jgi:hypothetical protein
MLEQVGAGRDDERSVRGLVIAAGGACHRLAGFLSCHAAQRPRGDKRGKYMYKLFRQQCLASHVPLRKDDQAGSRIQVGSSPHFRTDFPVSALWCRTV